MSTIRYLERGNGQPLIFLHGIGGDAQGWHNQLQVFASQYRCIAWNAPGCAGSAPIVNGSGIAQATFADYAHALYDWLCAINATQPILVGHSMGGMVVQEFLVHYPSFAKAVALYGSSPAFGSKVGVWQSAFIRARLSFLDEGATLSQKASELIHSMVAPGADEHELANAIVSMSQVSEEVYRANMQLLTTFDRREHLSHIQAPCLCVVGSADGNAPPPMVEKMAAKIPRASYVVLPNVGHLAHLENPALFNEALRAWLNNLTMTDG
jgi:3-oxoadipate enol-lactonase